IDNRVIGVRPFDGALVPALPLAILGDSAGQQTDRFAYDAESGRILTVPDGLPEIVLISRRRDATAAESNVRLLDVGTGLRHDRLRRQLHTGWTAEHLAAFGGELRFDRGPVALRGTATIHRNTADALAGLVGTLRMCLLSGEISATGVVRCTGLLAGRIMSVRLLDDGACEIVLQPGVMTTRTAIVAEAAPRHPYVYKLYVSY
ncbi:MAG: hypothetical protein ACREIV_08725, partial [Planctomycetaceae bacterium]